MSFKRPVLHCLVIRQVGSFSYTPRAGICQVVRTCEVSLKRPVLHCLVIRRVGSFSYTFRAGCLSVYTFRAGICLVVCPVTRFVLESVRSFGGWGVSLTRSVLESVRSFVRLGVSLTWSVLQYV